MTAREFVQWMAFYTICPFGDNWQDRRVSHQTLMLMACLTKNFPKDAKAYGPELPSWKTAQQVVLETIDREADAIRSLVRDQAAFDKRRR